MKNPTMRKLRNQGLTPIRYNSAQHGYQHGWIVSEGKRGALTIRLIGEERNRKLSVAESAFVEELTV